MRDVVYNRGSCVLRRIRRIVAGTAAVILVTGALAAPLSPGLVTNQRCVAARENCGNVTTDWVSLVGRYLGFIVVPFCVVWGLAEGVSRISAFSVVGGLATVALIAASVLAVLAAYVQFLMADFAWYGAIIALSGLIVALPILCIAVVLAPVIATTSRFIRSTAVAKRNAFITLAALAIGCPVGLMAMALALGAPPIALAFHPVFLRYSGLLVAGSWIGIWVPVTIWTSPTRAILSPWICPALGAVVASVTALPALLIAGGIDGSYAALPLAVWPLFPAVQGAIAGAMYSRWLHWSGQRPADGRTLMG